MSLYNLALQYIPRPILIRVSVMLRGFWDWYYSGNKYQDPINNKGYRMFLPYGQNKYTRRKNVLSPGTLSLERHRLMWLFLNHKTDFFTKPYKVLHLAPEQPFYKRFRALKNLDYTTGDYNSPIADIHFDLHKAPFEDNTFDVIFCNHVLEHVEDEMQCMRELYRIMTDGGWGIFQVPIDPNRTTTLQDPKINTPELREQYYWQRDHVRLFGLDYKDKLESVGFKVEVIDYVHEFSNTDIEKYRLDEKERMYIVRK